jgi:hypothetical protein
MWTVPSPGGQVSEMAGPRVLLRIGRGGRGVASPRPPQKGLPHGSPGAEPSDARIGVCGGLPPGCRVVGLAPGRRDATQPQRARSSMIPLPLEEPGQKKHLTQNQMFGSRQTADQSPRPKSLPIYISWYINDYGQPWTSSDVNPRMRPVHGRFAGTYGLLLATYGSEGYGFKSFEHATTLVARILPLLQAFFPRRAGCQI